MVDKTRGEIAYAVLSFGGFLGIGNEHYPVSWKVLRYDSNLGGYLYDWSDRRAELDDYYNDDFASLLDLEGMLPIHAQIVQVPVQGIIGQVPESPG